MSSPSPQGWCPAGGTQLPTGGSPTCPATTPTGSICVTFINQTSEQINIVAEYGSSTTCTTVAATQTTRISVTPPSYWTATGASTGLAYLEDYEVVGPQTFSLAPFIDYPSYTAHKPIPWAIATVGVSVTALAVAAWGFEVNRAERRAWCQANPQSCALIAYRDPKNGRLKYKGNPAGMPRNRWALPFALLVIVAGLLALGWAASRGAFGFSTLSPDACNARGSGWVWTSIADNGFARTLVRFTGLGTCANGRWQANCARQNLAVNNGANNIAWDSAAANSTTTTTWSCACIDPTNSNTYNCSGVALGNDYCSPCGSI